MYTPRTAAMSDEFQPSFNPHRTNRFSSTPIRARDEPAPLLGGPSRNRSSSVLLAIFPSHNMARRLSKPEFVKLRNPRFVLGDCTRGRNWATKPTIRLDSVNRLRRFFIDRPGGKKHPPVDSRSSTPTGIDSTCARTSDPQRIVRLWTPTTDTIQGLVDEVIRQGNR